MTARSSTSVIPAPYSDRICSFFDTFRGASAAFVFAPMVSPCGGVARRCAGGRQPVGSAVRTTPGVAGPHSGPYDPRARLFAVLYQAPVPPQEPLQAEQEHEEHKT